MSKRILPLAAWDAIADDWQDDRDSNRREIQRLERQVHSLVRMQKTYGMCLNLIACTMLAKSIAETRRELANAHHGFHRARYVTGRLRRLAGGAR